MTEASERALSPQQVEDDLRDLKRGFVDTVGNVTLATGATSTAVPRPGVSAGSFIALMPTNAAAAAEYGLGTTWVAPAKGAFTINHPNAGAARTYRYVIFTGRT